VGWSCRSAVKLVCELMKASSCWLSYTLPGLPGYQSKLVRLLTCEPCHLSHFRTIPAGPTTRQKCHSPSSPAQPCITHTRAQLCKIPITHTHGNSRQTRQRATLSPLVQPSQQIKAHQSAKQSSPYLADTSLPDLRSVLCLQRRTTLTRGPPR